MRSTAIAALLIVSVQGVALADIESLREFLRSVEAAGQVAVPLRGDGRIEINSGDAKQQIPFTMIVRPPADTYIEMGDGTKVLLLNAGEHAYILKKGATKAEEFPRTALFADSDFTREDLEPFQAARYKDERISDDSGNELTVMLSPKASQYALVVSTFDNDKKAPGKTLYYRDTVSNLVKIRRDGDYVLVGRKWMPTTISMETFKQRTQTTFTLQWTQSPTFPPELFDPLFLPRPSHLGAAPAATPASNLDRRKE